MQSRISLSLCLLCCLHYALCQEASAVAASAGGNAPAALSRFSPFSIRDENYALSTFAKVNWYQAQATCASQGMTLLSINSENDQRRVRNFLFVRAGNRLHLLNDLLWTSGTDLADEDSWVWFSNGRNLVYRNFQNGSPTKNSNVERCIGLNGVTGQWVNVDCFQQHYFICERRCADGGELYNNYN